MSNELQTSNMINELWLQIDKAEGATAKNILLNQVKELLKKPNFIYCEDRDEEDCMEFGTRIVLAMNSKLIVCDKHYEKWELHFDNIGHVCDDKPSIEPKPESFDYNIAENIIEAEKGDETKSDDFTIKVEILEPKVDDDIRLLRVGDLRLEFWYAKRVLKRITFLNEHGSMYANMAIGRHKQYTKDAYLVLYWLLDVSLNTVSKHYNKDGHYFNRTLDFVEKSINRKTYIETVAKVCTDEEIGLVKKYEKHFAESKQKIPTQ